MSRVAKDTFEAILARAEKDYAVGDANTMQMVALDMRDRLRAAEAAGKARVKELEREQDERQRQYLRDRDAAAQQGYDTAFAGKPLASAPKDGTAILLMDGDTDLPTVVRWVGNCLRVVWDNEIFNPSNIRGLGHVWFPVPGRNTARAALAASPKPEDVRRAALEEAAKVADGESFSAAGRWIACAIRALANGAAP